MKSINKFNSWLVAVVAALLAPVVYAADPTTVTELAQQADSADAQSGVLIAGAVVLSLVLVVWGIKKIFSLFGR